MKRNRHFKPQVFSTEKELQYEVQCAIDNIEETDKISYKRCELMTEILTKLSFYLPDIYSVFFDYESTLIIKSHATPGFSFELFVPTTMINEYDDAGFAMLTIRHMEFRYSLNRPSCIICPLMNLEGNKPLNLDVAINYIKAIVRNPKVAFFHFWNSINYRLKCDELLSEESFTEENIKKANEAYKYYFEKKQKASAIVSEYYTEFKKLVSEVCSKYADKIYKLGWGIVRPIWDYTCGKSIHVCNIAIRTRAKIYYGDKKLYDKFAKEFAMEFSNLIKQYTAKYYDAVLKDPPAYQTCKGYFGFFKPIYPMKIIVDGYEFNTYDCIPENRDVFGYLLSDKSPRTTDWFNKVIYVKRKGE